MQWFCWSNHQRSGQVTTTIQLMKGTKGSMSMQKDNIFEFGREAAENSLKFLKVTGSLCLILVWGNYYVGVCLHLCSTCTFTNTAKMLQESEPWTNPLHLELLIIQISGTQITIHTLQWMHSTWKQLLNKKLRKTWFICLLSYWSKHTSTTV